MWRQFAPGASHLRLVEQGQCAVRKRGKSLYDNHMAGNTRSCPWPPFRAVISLHERISATAPIRQDAMSRPKAGRCSRRCSTCGPISGRPTARDLKDAGPVRQRADLRRQARDHRGAVHLQMGDRRARWPRYRAGRPRQLARAGRWRAPVLLTLAYGGMRILMACSRNGATASSPRWRCTRCGGSRFSPSSTCTGCRCASISSARPAA